MDARKGEGDRVLLWNLKFRFRERKSEEMVKNHRSLRTYLAIQHRKWLDEAHFLLVFSRNSSKKLVKFFTKCSNCF